MQETSSSAGTCPADEVLKSLARGRLSTAGPWLSHVDQCQSCRDRFDAILNSSDAQATFASEGSFTSQLGSNSSDSFGDRMRRALGGAFAETQQVLRPPESPDELGRLGPYRVLELLGSGGMGLVLLAEETALNRRVALKVMRPHLAADPIAHQRFLREARAMAQIEHDHVVPIYRVDEDHGAPYVAMPLLQGESLAVRLGREGRLPAMVAIDIGRQIAEGLAAAHAKGLVHRDIKPANVWLEPRGEDAVRVRLLDFGLARAVNQQGEISHSGAVLGTPAYMSPEQAQGHTVDERSDLFSLGVILYRMATGNAAFTGEDPLGIIWQVVEVTPAAPDAVAANLPAGFSRLIMQLLEKAPARRPASAREVAERLARLGSATPARKSRRLRNRVVVALAVVLCAILAIGLWARFKPESPDAKNDSNPAAFSWRLDPQRIPEVERWSNQPNELVAVIGSQKRRHWGPVHALAAAENGSMLISDSIGDGVRFWHPRSLKPIGRAASRPEFIRALAITRDGKRLVTTNNLGQLEVWELDPPNATRSVAPIYADASVGGLVIDASGTRVYTADFTDGVVREYELSKSALKPRRVFKERLGEAWSLAVSTDGRWLAASSKYGAVGAWDLGESTPRFVSLREASKDDSYFNLAFGPDSKHLYLVSQGARSAVYDLSTGSAKKAVEFATNTDFPWAAFIGDSGKRLIRVGQHSLQVFDLQANPPKRIGSTNVPFAIESAAFDPQSARVFTGHGDGGVRAWDVSGTTPMEIEPLPYALLVQAAVSPDGRLAVIHRKTAERRDSLELFDLSGVEPARAELLLREPLSVGSLEISADSRSLFAAVVGSTAIIKWELSDNRPVGQVVVEAQYRQLGRTPRLIRVSRDATQFINFDLALQAHFLIDANGTTKTLIMPQEPGFVQVLDGSFDSDGRRIVAVARQDERACLIRWNERELPELKSLPGGFSWRWLVVAANKLSVVGVGKGGMFELDVRPELGKPRKLFDLKSDGGAVRAVASSADGKRLAIATASGRLVILDPADGSIEHDWQLPGAPTQIAFTRNGSGLMAASLNGTVLLFRLDHNQP